MDKRAVQAIENHSSAGKTLSRKSRSIRIRPLCKVWNKELVCFASEFEDFLRETRLTVCGRNPISVLLHVSDRTNANTDLSSRLATRGVEETTLD